MMFHMLSPFIYRYLIYLKSTTILCKTEVQILKNKYKFQQNHQDNIGAVNFLS